MALIPYKNNFVEENLDTIDKKAVKPELTFMFVGPARMSNLKAEDLINFTTAIQGMIDISNDTLNLDYGILKLIGAVNSVDITIGQQIMPIKPLGSKSVVLESSDSITGSMSISRLVIPNNIIKVLKNRQYAHNKSIDDLALELVKRVTNPVLNRDNTINYDMEILRRPFGIVLVEFNKGYNTPVGINYFEMCKISSYSKSISAGQAVLIEGMSIQFTRVRGVI